MRKLNKLEFMTGFLMGIFWGALLDAVFLFLFRIIYNVVAENPVVYEWWMIFVLIAIPLVSGLVMGRAIASLHLEDY